MNFPPLRLMSAAKLSMMSSASAGMKLASLFWPTKVCLVHAVASDSKVEDFDTAKARFKLSSDAVVEFDVATMNEGVAKQSDASSSMLWTRAEGALAGRSTQSLDVRAIASIDRS